MSFAVCRVAYLIAKSFAGKPYIGFSHILNRPYFMNAYLLLVLIDVYLLFAVYLTL